MDCEQIAQISNAMRYQYQNPADNCETMKDELFNLANSCFTQLLHANS